MRWTELNGGYLVCGSMQNHAGPKNMCKKTGETCDGQSSMGGYLASRLIRYLNNVKVWYSQLCSFRAIKTKFGHLKFSKENNHKVSGLRWHLTAVKSWSFFFTLQKQGLKVLTLILVSQFIFCVMRLEVYEFVNFYFFWLLNFSCIGPLSWFLAKN